MKIKKKLYRVTLAWDANDYEQGDFCEKFWAKDEDDAIKQCATAMVDSSEAVSKRRRRDFITWRINNAQRDGRDHTDDVACSVRNDVHDLLAGPSGTLTWEAEHAKRVIYDLLALYGGMECA